MGTEIKQVSVECGYSLPQLIYLRNKRPEPSYYRRIFDLALSAFFQELYLVFLFPVFIVLVIAFNNHQSSDAPTARERRDLSLLVAASVLTLAFLVESVIETLRQMMVLVRCGRIMAPPYRSLEVQEGNQHMTFASLAMVFGFGVFIFSPNKDSIGRDIGYACRKFHVSLYWYNHADHRRRRLDYLTRAAP